MTRTRQLLMLAAGGVGVAAALLGAPTAAADRTAEAAPTTHCFPAARALAAAPSSVARPPTVPPPERQIDATPNDLASWAARSSTVPGFGWGY